MAEDSLSSMTVPQLKELLKEKGLAVGGKKAELVARLEENTVQTVVKSAKPSVRASEDLPFIPALLAGGIGAVEFDGRKAVSFAVTFFVFIMMIVGLNSLSWYSMGFEEIDGNVGMSFEIGLDEYEGVMDEGDGAVETMEESLDSCYMLGMYGSLIMDDAKAGESNCDTLSSGGGIVQFSIWFSLIGVILLLVFSIADGFGVFYSGPIADNSEMIEKILWGISVFPLLLGVIIYGFYVGWFVDLEFGETTADVADEFNLFSHLGWMWWLMMLSSIAYTWVVYNERIKTLISSIKDRN